MPKPICFFIMPFGIKKTFSDNPKFPKEINFDLLWEKAYEPALENNYEPIRADQDLGALIIKEMIERIVIADLVIADVTIPNANVYYELGIRHAAKQYNSVMIAADGSRQLFDIQQMPQLRFPIKSGTVDDFQAKNIIEKIQSSLANFAKGESPVFQSVQGYPENQNIDKASSFKSYTNKYLTFQSDLEELRLYKKKDEKEEKLKVFISNYKSLIENKSSVGKNLLELIRDEFGWTKVLRYINTMPVEFQNDEYVKEQKFLAIGKTDNPEKAIANLQILIKNYGESSERYGLIGGRYKEMHKNSGDISDLNNAIKYYRKGMECDLNDFFPSCNLPHLYLKRNRPKDKEKANQAAVIARLACERAKNLNSTNKWVRPTLLLMAFIEGNAEAAENLVEEIEEENNITAWVLDTTIADLKSSIELHEDQAIKQSLLDILNQIIAQIKK